MITGFIPANKSILEESKNNFQLDLFSTSITDTPVLGSAGVGLTI